MPRNSNPESPSFTAGRLNKTYLGDSVYIEFTNGVLKLTTENGGDPSNTIYLDFDVYVEMMHYIRDTCFSPDTRGMTKQ